MKEEQNQILFVDACVRAASRTRRLAEAVLGRLEGSVERVNLGDGSVVPMDGAALKTRTALAEAGRFDGPVFERARQFAAADEIVIAAPYWDLAFPALLKAYLEAVTVSGVTFRYNEQGVPEGLCRAGRLIYVATAGGPIFGENMGFSYVKALARNFYGIDDVRYFDAQGLDIVGADVEGIMARAQRQIADGL